MAWWKAGGLVTWWRGPGGCASERGFVDPSPPRRRRASERWRRRSRRPPMRRQSSSGAQSDSWRFRSRDFDRLRGA
eukprot:2390986-Heterocapsa_arctica.AAC.1